MAIRLDPISEVGVRDIAIDLTPRLEAAEVLTGATAVVSQDTTLLAITNVAANTVAIDEDGVTAAIGKAIGFTVNGAGILANADVELKITYVGDTGTTDIVTVIQPVLSRVFEQELEPFVIQRYADYEKTVTLAIGGAAINNTDYTILCKMRNRPKIDHEEPVLFFSADFIPFTVTPSVTVLSQVLITLLAADTVQLITTEGATDDQLPLIDFQMTAAVGGKVFTTLPQTVRILNTQAHA